ncbi:MAG TPA: alpha-L-fucosidase, partial [Mariniphaga sp.]|nr:alpha-L-fucosidase [Mariniphaga sp.]
MKLKHLILVMIMLIGQIASAQEKIWNETEEEKAQRLSWWTDARFGMFIHWGIYALPARHEW